MAQNTPTGDAKPVPALTMADLAPAKDNDYAGYRNPPAYFVPLKVRQELAADEARNATK